MVQASTRKCNLKHYQRKGNDPNFKHEWFTAVQFLYPQNSGKLVQRKQL